jgi:xanthine dehydrogenase accessory factor
VDKELEIWRNALAALGRGERCMLLVVVESLGSSPGRAGFKALVTEGGELHGSIGGGSMEHKLVELAKARMSAAGVGPSSGESHAPGLPHHGKDGSIAPLLKRQVHRAEEATDRSGMICSGEQTVAFFHLELGQMDLVREILSKLEDHQPVGLLLDQTGMHLDVLPSPGADQLLVREGAEHWHYREQLGSMPRIVILGAGHVGLALSRTMHQLGFHIHLMDDRAGLNTMARNQWAHRRSVVDYHRIGDVVQEDPGLFVVLVSFGYRTDALLVRQLVRKRFRYLGMMGSTGKIGKLLADMRQEGFTEEEIARVRTPIGLPIHSRTPEEIAVSIAAEIIAVKNGAMP